MKPAEFHPDAAEEAREAAAYYEGIRLGLGADFQTELDAALTRIRDNPLLYAAESGEIRICPLQRFPYSIFYEDFDHRVWIVRSATTAVALDIGRIADQVEKG